MTRSEITASEPLSQMIDPQRTALLVIDVQADFVQADGAIGRSGADLSGVPLALANIEALVAAARRAGATLAFARVVTTPDADPPALKRLNARRGGAPTDIALCRDGDPGCDYVGVRPARGDIEVTKLLYDAFHDTDLDGELRRRGVEALVAVGFSTHCCVDATCRDAFHRGFDVFVVSDATDAYSAEVQRATLKTLTATCALEVETAAVLDAWGRLP
jgi:nicotinamidase-related amidase